MELFSGRFVTDTATVTLFDVKAVEDLVDQDGDWWTLPKGELVEVNKGRVFFAGLGSDGAYGITVTLSSAGGLYQQRLVNVSGRFFVGAAEEMVGDGLVPEGVRGGGFFDVKPGVYGVSAALAGNVLTIFLSPVDGNDHSNQLSTPLKIAQIA